MNYQDILKAINDANNDKGFQSLGEDLSGYSGTKLIAALQSLTNIFSRDNNKNIYLEVGVFQGLTLTSVASCNSEVNCYGIDNFSQFDKNSTNMNIALDRFKKFTNGNTKLINEDFEEFTKIHPQHMNKEDESLVRKGWWDGVNIIYRDSNKELPRKYPVVENDLQIYYDDHLVHSAKYSRYAHKILRAFSFGFIPALAYTFFFFLTPKPKKKQFKSGNIK